ncbi:MAG TPA: response regulator [Polyangia bacterium]|jgi:DNA-binding NtrC family response regulator
MSLPLPWWVLVVDDDAEVNALIVEMLRDEGFAAQGLTQARAAMALLESATPPGFIIADMTMPEIDGIDLVGRAESHGIKGLLITAADPRRLKAAAAALQSAPVMRKPFEVDELIRVVARYRPSDGADDVAAPVSCSA